MRYGDAHALKIESSKT